MRSFLEGGSLTYPCHRTESIFPKQNMLLSTESFRFSTVLMENPSFDGVEFARYTANCGSPDVCSANHLHI